MSNIHLNQISHVLRRSAQMSTQQAADLDTPPADIDVVIGNLKYMPGWSLALIIVTVLIFGLCIFSVDYTLSGVVATLAAVEGQQVNYVLESDAPKFNDNGNGNNNNNNTVDPEPVMVLERPITSSIRATLRHLRSRAGFAARWRGLSAFLSILVVAGIVESLFDGILGVRSPVKTGRVGPRSVSDVLLRILVSMLSSVVLARWHMAWTHVVISEPSSKPWYRRVPPMKTWKTIAGPTALSALASRSIFIVPILLTGNLRGHFGASDVASLFAAAVLTIVMYVGIVVPVNICLVRMQASLLPEEDETIIPFDRTFGGKVVPEIVGGNGCLGFVDAWKSLDRAARVRVVKVYVKAMAVQVAMYLGFAIVLGCEIALAIAYSKDGPKKDE